MLEHSLPKGLPIVILNPTPEFYINSGADSSTLVQLLKVSWALAGAFFEQLDSFLFVFLLNNKTINNIYCRV